jgi:hypothetical protein
VKKIVTIVLFSLFAFSMQAQITIGGNVYGGGNAGETKGNTRVTVYEGDLNNVYGGARMADVNGNAFVHIDAEHASSYIIINKVYGGNDISGNVGVVPQGEASPKALPEELTKAGDNKVTKDWDTFVRVSTKMQADGKTVDASQKTYIGQLFGGGNGNYTYSSETVGNDVTHILKDAETGVEILRTKNDIHQPDLGKAYLELLGGSIVNVFGGGNMATVTEDAVIHLDNPSEVVNHIKVKDGKEDNTNGTDILTEARFIKMGINYKFTYPNSGAFQIGNLFGGNNKVDMAIQPRWNLLGGKVRNLYSGGNEGRMTCPQGLLLVIPENSTLTVDNVYGGCRKADVRPLDASGKDVPNAQILLADNPTGIPAGFSARTRILGGTINNVYGGNDISGNVYGGNTVAILTTIHGSVYGGGNGSYAYTDNPALKNELLWRDFYYNPKDILGLSGDTFTELQSAEALNKVRPNAEQVSLLLRGKADKPVFVEGSVFVGGNSASLQELTEIPNRQAHVKIGSYVTIDSLFLGNNGANMVKYNEEVRNEDGLVQTEGVLRTFANTTIAGSKFNSMDLTKLDVFDKYMEGCAMKLLPSVVFDDVEGYVPYSSQFGSFYCGGNVGSILTNGLTEISFNEKAIIYEKFVGGCNRANVKATEFNAAYYGGLLGAPDSNGDKLKLNFSHLKIQPMRWKDPTDKLKGLEWNTVVYNATTQKFDNVPNVASTEGGQNIPSTADDIVRRLKGGNIYGGCYESGHVNGNVILNINETLMERDKLFDLTDEGDILYENTEKGKYNITKRNTGVILSEQGMDVLGDALNVFGAGYGADSEIWGSTTINLNKGYVFQIFGGGEMGAIGKKNEEGKYTYDEKYSTYINLNGDASLPGVARGAAGDSEDMAECEFIYGGAFEGAIAGSTHINLGNGRIFNSFAGSCNADILGHTETYVGLNRAGNEGFPWIRDHIYGGNDLGGSILATNSPTFSDRIRDDVKAMVAEAHPVSSYMEYNQGRVRSILGGCFGDYDYNNDPAYKVGTDPDCRVASKPYLHNAFVNIRPNTNTSNVIERVFGAGEGFSGDRDGDKSQDHSYVLIDIPEGIDNFADMEIFGAGAYNGLGMRYKAEDTFNGTVELSEASAVIDLMRGRVSAAYGGSYEEGITRRTLVNVPEKSTIKINNIFGGAYGMHILPPCDVYEANVNYLGGDARVNGAIYGGNNNVRRTLYSKVNVSAPVLKENGYSGTIYGAGRGQYTWSEYTEVNLNKGANVWEVYGGGELGNVLNAESVQKYLQLYSGQPADMVANEDDYWGNPDKWEGGTVGGTLKAAYKTEWLEAWKDAWTIGDYYDPVGEFKRYVYYPEKPYQYTNLLNPLVRKAEMDDRDYSKLTDDQKARTYQRYNTNVLIHEGATVGNYAYGGGYGSESIPLSGGVHGSTYIALLGGTVGKDIYAAGTTGSVCDIFGAGAPNESAAGFTASANAYIQGGTARNVYGGGWRGGVGYHEGLISDVANNKDDRDGEVHIVVGDLNGTSFTNGIPAIQRNVYGGGEGGGIFGTAHVTINNGRIGYRYKNNDYVEELDDAKAGDNLLDESGNVFGGGYVANSYVDISDVKVYGGIIRGGLYGGGEIGPIGRGTVKEGAAAPSGTIVNGLAKIYKPGETHVTLYNGHVMRDVFGGGRGFDNWGGEGYMTPAEKQTMDLSSKGYVFGKTDVQILGGVVGTEANVAKGFGNVFGGGNIGYVYSGTGTKQEKAVPGTSDKTAYYYDASGKLTEDCRVLITPYCQAKSDVTIGGTTYKAGQYVPASALDKLKNKSADPLWNSLDLTGIIVHNAVFAGGNVTLGDENVYANAKTVLGNVSANVVDVYNRDLITIGTEHVGGLYGDGNLTLVDGYRELNITNYGTDYYGMSDNISLEEYYQLTDRERAYFALEYRCKTGYTSKTSAGTTKTYAAGERITEEIYNGLAESDKSNWELWGFCSIYAGRLLNTIQRADFCGIFGSRLVMQGAKDRVPGVADKTDYTVNRVGEVSLNQVRSIAGETDEDAKTHGNYFGIYSVVNYMGALTSDVDFYNTTRTTDNANYVADGKTFYQWKEAFGTERKRNNGKVANHVALASGVFLELTTEKSTPETKDWGYITGVAQLDLINVKAGLGGGYVYAKNEHGVRSNSGNDHTILSSYNLPSASHDKAVTNKVFVYTPSDASKKEVQTSGNFVHNVKQIIDDCYPTTNAYLGADAAPAHYWFIRGTSYVYDQYITAYTGAASAYSKTQKIPLNISAASFGRIKLEDVKTNLYAYYFSTEPNASDRTPLQNTDENAETYSVLVNNDVTYHLNDSITYWDWLQLSEVDQRHFVSDTYVTVAECKIGDKTYPEGTVLLPADYEKLKASAPKKDIDGKTVPSVYHMTKEEDVAFDYVFRLSNNLTHANGYVVTYAVDNPTAWNPQDPNCTYSPKTTGVYGQQYYDAGDIIDKTTHDDYENMGANKPADTAEKKQAKMVEAYVTTADVKFTDGDKTYNFIKGTALCKEDYSAAAWSTISSKVELARVCTGTLEFEGANAKNSMLYGEVVTTERYNEVVEMYKTTFKVSDAQARTAVDQQLSKAYICYEAGYYGGGYFEAGQKYTALKGWSSLTSEDRKNFAFNYDAFNLLIDPNYSGDTQLYDNKQAPFTYSSVQPIDYQAKYIGHDVLSYIDNNGAAQTLNPNVVITREQYEAIPNEQYHYSPVKVDNMTMYVVKSAFARGDTPYSVGQTITAETFSYLTSDQKAQVEIIDFEPSDINKTYYYCREDYHISNDVNGHAVKDALNNYKLYDKGSDVVPGVLISEDDYRQLTNLQKAFSIQGNAPEEMTTLYVANQSDIFDLQKDRIITVIFSYDYTESDESGIHIEPVSERHIVNIHLHFESGVPEIATLHSPAPALPGDNVGLMKPAIKPGAYEIMGGGWEIFQNEEDAERHRNGVEFTNKTPVYWYQDGQYLAYYAKTYLGKTYSNYVPFTVANYHDLKAVMDDQEHHLYIDHPDVKRASKIYINDYADDEKSGLDLLKDLYDLSVTPTTYDREGNAQKVPSGNLAGHTGLNNTGTKGVQGMQNLEVFLHSDLAPKAYAGNWTPIANGDGQCYNGNIHGEGYHIDNLPSSFIGHLCGHVYNLGVSGTFTSAGLADSGDGYVENCWVKTTGTPDAGVKAVFGNPTASNWTQVNNCYYTAPEGTDYASGPAIRKAERAFYNGEVAYDLNAFYLKERYNRQAASDKIETYQYVESRFTNPDFLYANGVIPTEDDPRLKTDADGNYFYSPIWPDDYLFFGQTLNYGYQFSQTGEGQEVPSHLVKTDETNVLDITNASNRVYRTPAYYGNKQISTFHFNPYAVMAAKSADGQYEVYPGMTAVDFTGHNDLGYSKNETNGIFFAPIMDADITLTGVANADETQNLLVYAPKQGSDNANVLGDYFGVPEPVYGELDDDATTGMKAEYRAVAALAASEVSAVKGHVSYLDDAGKYVAVTDHLLVDKQDFNSPIAYQFVADHRMWYQRTPDNYVSMKKGAKLGWESVCIPFTAELVTTPQKGEITHFYGNSNKGHEYWLREFKGGKDDSNDATIFVADFQKPAVGEETKSFTNTFLWDYYYQYGNRKDVNSDDYQNYYSESHSYVGYPYTKAGTPYIVGFPGDYYYEFDLSGSFVPEYTAGWPGSRTLDRQTITFASETGVQIGVSDDELTGVKVGNYTFRPNYAATPLSTPSYVLNADGSSYDKAETTITMPFRPYFTSTSNGARTRSIVFGDEGSQLGGDEDLSHSGQNLIITTREHKIIVESQLRYVTDVRIVNPAGITMKTFTIKPGEVVETYMINAGVYIVQSTDARYTKKLAVK